MAVEIPKIALQVLTELTGEPRFDVALWMALRDTIEHRMEKIAVERAAYGKKYGLDFEAFKKLWDAGQVTNQYAYEVEKDYLEWEGLVMRKAKLVETFRWLS